MDCRCAAFPRKRNCLHHSEESQHGLRLVQTKISRSKLMKFTSFAQQRRELADKCRMLVKLPHFQTTPTLLGILHLQFLFSEKNCGLPLFPFLSPPTPKALLTGMGPCTWRCSAGGTSGHCSALCL
jgi:hypothetical protein